jgi:hypothetical protein
MIAVHWAWHHAEEISRTTVVVELILHAACKIYRIVKILVASLMISITRNTRVGWLGLMTLQTAL